MEAVDHIYFFEREGKKIPNIERLINLLKSDPKPGNLVHAGLTKIFFQDGAFEVTNVEVKGGGKDVDIELDNKINIQVWHGASTATHNIIKGKMSSLGGVPVDWDKDEKKIFDKLTQLPNNNPGFLINYNYHMGIQFMLPEWKQKIPENKAIIELFHVNHGDGIQNEARLHCSGDFKYTELAKKIATSLGFHLK